MCPTRNSPIMEKVYLGRCQEMSKISFNVDEKGISIITEPEKEASPFIDKYGNVWKVKEFVNSGEFYEYTTNTTKNHFGAVETELIKYE
jgi:hypothetical protein